MTRREKQKFIRKHFWRQCRVVLTDVKQTKYNKRLQRKKGKISEVSYGRKKHSCYICFEKFYTKEDLAAHKFIHFCEKSNNTFSDDDEENQDSSLGEIKSSKTDKQLYSVIVGPDEDKVETTEQLQEINSEPESIQHTTQMAETEVILKETNYKCLKCNVYFRNQVDVKAHPHNQYFCKYYCTQCQRQFNTKGGFIVHVLQHDITKVSKLSYRCNKCPFSFDDCYKLKRHYATAHSSELQNTSKYAESIVNSREDIQADVNNSQSETISGGTKGDLSSVSSEIPKDVMLENVRKDSENPITGSIPIFDCDVCYDVFASDKALKRHKMLHIELEKKLDDNVSILIDDDEIEFIQKDDTSDKNQIVSNFITTQKPSLPNFIATPMAQLTPIRSDLTTKMQTSKPNILTKEPMSKLEGPDTTKYSEKRDNDSSKLFNVKVDSKTDKKKITSDITEMLAGKKCLSKVQIPRYSSFKKSYKTIFKTQLNVCDQQLPIEMPELQAITRNLGSPKQTENSAATDTPKNVSESDKPKYMYVLCPPNINQSMGMPFGGQALMSIDSNTILGNQTSGFVANNQDKTNTTTTMPGSSGPNQFIINQQINTGGVVINPQASGVPGSSLMFNQPQNVESQAPGVQQSQILQALSGLQGADGGQMFYIVMPPNNQNVQVHPTQQPQIPSNPQLLQQQTVIPPMDGVKSPNARHDAKTFSKETKEQKNMRKVVNKKLNSDKVSSPSFCKRSSTNVTIVTPDITTIDDSNSSESSTNLLPGKATEKENDSILKEAFGGNSEFIMPIITSIGTVAEDSKNKKEKVRKDPVSVYESEFAKFLEQTEDSKKSEDIKTLKKAFRNNAMTSLRAARIHKPVTSQLTSDSNDDDVILLDDDSSSNEYVPKDDTSNKPSQVNAAIESKSDTQTKPKIFVKKLSDLLSSSQTTMHKPQVTANSTSSFSSSQTSMQELQVTENSTSLAFQHCCLRCNVQLKDWYELRIHLKSRHNIYACVYSGCSIFNTLDEYRLHILQVHHCPRCNNDYGNLTLHQNRCTVEFQITNVQSLESSQSVLKKSTSAKSEEKSSSSDIFSQTGTEVNF